MTTLTLHQTDLFHSPTPAASQSTKQRTSVPLLSRSPVAGEGIYELHLLQEVVSPRPADGQRSSPTRWVLVTDALERLRRELDQLSQPPRALVLAPDAGPFLSSVSTQADVVALLDLLAERNVPLWLMTNGYIRPAARDALVRHRDRVQVTVSLSTLDRDLQHALEPEGASPRLRLRQIAGLKRQGVNVRVEIGPLVPGLTDTRANLVALFEELALMGVHQVTTSYLALPVDGPSPMVRSLTALGLEDQALEAFMDGPVMTTASLGRVRLLPKRHRQRGYAQALSLGSSRGVAVRINAWTNPDFIIRPAKAPTALPRLGRRSPIYTRAS